MAKRGPILPQEIDGAARIVPPEEFPVWLRLLIAGSGLTVTDYAAKIGVSRQALHALLRGDNAPSRQVLEKSGLEVTYRVRDGFTLPTPPTANPRTK
jgi:transcriptional regulator with XRE-family HTH domain